jgi:hypothetical protein
VETQADNHPWDVYDGSHEVNNEVYLPYKISNTCKLTDGAKTVQLMTISSS